MLFEVFLDRIAKCLLSDHHMMPGSGKEVQLALGPDGSSVRKLHRDTTEQLLVKSTCLFFCYSSQILLHCRAYRNSCFSPNPSPADFSKQFACTAVSPFPHLHKSFLNCFPLAAFSQLLPVQTEPHSTGGYEILCVWAGLIFSISVLH